MQEVKDACSLQQLFQEECALLFYAAPWSEYAVISKHMMDHVERYAVIGKIPMSFYFGEFVNDLVPLAERLVGAGVPADLAFTGNGSLSFFQRGKHVHLMRSVMGEGTWVVWQNIKAVFGIHAR